MSPLEVMVLHVKSHCKLYFGADLMWKSVVMPGDFYLLKRLQGTLLMRCHYNKALSASFSPIE